MNCIKIIFIKPQDHFFDIITKRSSFFIFLFLLSLCTILMENQVRLYHLASMHRWLLKTFYFLEHTEYDRGKLKDGLPLIY